MASHRRTRSHSVRRNKSKHVSRKTKSHKVRSHKYKKTGSKRKSRKSKKQSGGGCGCSNKPIHKQKGGKRSKKRRTKKSKKSKQSGGGCNTAKTSSVGNYGSGLYWPKTLPGGPQ